MELPVALAGGAKEEGTREPVPEGYALADGAAKGLKGFPAAGRNVSPAAPMPLEPEKPKAGAPPPPLPPPPPPPPPPRFGSETAALPPNKSPVGAERDPPKPKFGGVDVAAGWTPKGDATKPAGVDEAGDGANGLLPAAVGAPKGFPPPAKGLAAVFPAPLDAPPKMLPEDDIPPPKMLPFSWVVP